MNRHKATQSQSVIMTTDKSGRARKQIKFWLDATKPDQAAMGEALDTMRKDKKQNFAGFMRDAIALMLALLSGDMSVLVRLFPDVVQDIRNEATIALQAENARLQAQIEVLQSTIETNEQDIAELEQENDKLYSDNRGYVSQLDKLKAENSRQPAQDNSAIEAKIDRLESLIISNGYRPEIPAQSHHTAHNSASAGLKGLGATDGNAGGLQPMTLPKPAGPKSLNVPQFSTPTFDTDEDEDMLEVKRDAAAGDRAVQNFLKSAMGLQGIGHG